VSVVFVCFVFVFILGANAESISAIESVVTDVTVAWSIHPSVTLVHPAKAVGQNEMPFGRDARVVPSNIVLDSGPDPPMRRGDLEFKTRSSQ